MFKELTLRNFLSFGPDSEPVTLGPLNVLLGANGAGKSNFIEAVALLSTMPRDESLQAYIRAGGGIGEWIHKGPPAAEWLEIEAVVALSRRPPNAPALPDRRASGLSAYGDLRHRIRIAEAARRIEILDERIEGAEAMSGEPAPSLYFGFEGAIAHINHSGVYLDTPRAELVPDASILSQVRGPGGQSMLGRLAAEYMPIALVREWTLGRNATCRRSQPPDLAADFFRGDGANLALVLNDLQRFPAVRRRIDGYLQDLAPGFEGYGVSLVEGSVQLLLTESGDRVIAAPRLSDGTLRFLALLTVLLHPVPPPVVVIEEPEIGMHPDLLPTLAKLLMEASTRTQLIVTTHSDILVDALTPMPESVLFCDKVEGETVIRRATPAEIASTCGPEAPEPMGLGHAWLNGYFGGRRW